MSLSTQQKIIEGKSCIVVQYPGMEGLRIWTSLVKLLGPSVALLGKSLGSDLKDAKSVSKLVEADIDLQKLFSSMSEAIMIATDKIDEATIEQLVLRILQSTKVDNAEVNAQSFNLMFSGNYGMLFKLLAFTLQVNYSSFLGGKGHSTTTDPSNKSLSSVQS